MSLSNNPRAKADNGGSGADRRDPLRAFRFKVTIDGRGDVPSMILRCAECSGLSIESETHEYREGGLNAYAHRFRGAVKFPPLVLKRGLLQTTGLMPWFQHVMNGKTPRSSGLIALLGESGDKPVMSWTLVDAYPVKWTGPDLRADSSSLGFESVELVHRGLIWKLG